MVKNYVLKCQRQHKIFTFKKFDFHFLKNTDGGGRGRSRRRGRRGDGELQLRLHTHLQSDVGPVDAVVGDVEVERRCLLDAGERDGHIVVVGLQGDAADVGVAGEEQEGLGDDARPHVRDELQADGTAALHSLRLVEAEVAAAAVILRTWVGTWGGGGATGESGPVYIQVNILGLV